MTRQETTLGNVRLDRRKVIIGLGMMAASATAFARVPVPNRPKLPKKEFEDLIPDSVGQWQFATVSGVVLPPPDALSERLYDNLVTRIYTNPAGEAVMFLAAYNNRQDGVLQIHRPEVCYPAGGFTLSQTEQTRIPLGPSLTLPAHAFVAKARDREETVLYWTRVGSQFPQQWSEQRLAVIAANLRGIIPDGLLFRVSTFGNSGAELGMLKDFTRSFIAASPAKLRSVMLSGGQ